MFFLTSSDCGANVYSNDTSRALRKRRQKCGVKPVPGVRPITCCRLHSIEREKARQEEGLQVGNFTFAQQCHGVLQAQSKEIRLRLGEERKERIEKRFKKSFG